MQRSHGHSINVLHHQTLIGSLVGSGRYQNASEVLREGLRLIEQRDALETVKLKALQEAAHFGFADLDNGRYHDVAELTSRRTSAASAGRLAKSNGICRTTMATTK